MEFDKYLSAGKVVKGQKDTQQAKALVKMSKDALRSAKLLPLDTGSASSVLSLAYTALRELLEALCLLEGYKVYSHEAYTYYLKMIDEERIAQNFDRFRKLRNGVEYYGKPVSVDVTKQACADIEKLCATLQKMIEAKM